jgi:hypothetical protein
MVCVYCGRFWLRSRRVVFLAEIRRILALAGAADLATAGDRKQQAIV